MPYLASLLALAGIHLLDVASPGPAFVATVRVSIQHSRRNAFLHSLGLGSAALVWAAGAIAGLQALMLQVGWLYRLLQLAGGMYLAYIGIMDWIHARDPFLIDETGIGGLTGIQAFRRGFAVNIANPKAIIFFASIFVALLKPSWPLWVRFIAIAIVTIDETAWFALIALILATRRAQSAYRRAKTALDRVTGSFMMAFGGKLILNAHLSK